MKIPKNKPKPWMKKVVIGGAVFVVGAVGTAVLVPKALAAVGFGSGEFI